MCEQAVTLAHLVVRGSSEHLALSMCVRRILLGNSCSEFQSNLQLLNCLETAKRSHGGCVMFLLDSDEKNL